ncbi:MAG: hypothetical protein HOW73_20205 [Polyangiaceae bacterium]|nr:hypothetical protein [Polyangiaceae bacterium]
MSDLHVFTDDTDCVIARDVHDAVAVMRETYGEGYEPPNHDGVIELEQLADDAELTIWADPNGDVGEPHADGNALLTQPCSAWIAKRGRGFLCSTEY